MTPGPPRGPASPGPAPSGGPASPGPAPSGGPVGGTGGGTAAALTELSVGEFLAALAAPRPAPGGGGAAALAVALAASLGAMTAGLSERRLGPVEAGRLAAQGRELSERAAELIQADADGYQAVLAARRAGGDPGAALSAASEVPMRIAELAAAAASLAAGLADGGNPALRGDAVTAVLLAQAGAAAAAGLIGINLAGQPGDGLPARARQLAAEIAAHAAAVTGS